MERFTEFQTEQKVAGRCVARRLPAGSMAVLRAEREELEEELRQLRASVQIYAEVVRRMTEKAGARIEERFSQQAA
jgi:hypothetical protein